MPRTIRTFYALLLLIAYSANIRAEDAPIPPDTPSEKCEAVPARTLDGLRILAGTDPVPFVFSCPAIPAAAATCRSAPGRQTDSRASSSRSITQGAWSCIFADSVSGWVPSNRLGPMPDTPAIPAADWLGWWRNGPP